VIGWAGSTLSTVLDDSDAISKGGSKAMSGEITLPEITIEGDPNSQPVTASDWWAQGFISGYNAPDATPERPLMINDDLAASFFQGAAAGQQAVREVSVELETQLTGQPQIGPDIGGESLEKAQERFKQAFEELFHQHMPHTESESEPLEPLPTPNIVLVE
jgi:hypothetical protein